MERNLVKTAIYSFIISFLLLLIEIQRERYTTDVNGMGSIEETSYPDFFFGTTGQVASISLHFQMNKK